MEKKQRERFNERERGSRERKVREAKKSTKRGIK